MHIVVALEWTQDRTFHKKCRMRESYDAALFRIKLFQQKPENNLGLFYNAASKSAYLSANASSIVLPDFSRYFFTVKNPSE